MSAIQLLEKLGANPNYKINENEKLTLEELKALEDKCPEIRCLLLPAEDDESEGSDEDEEDQSTNGIAVNGN